MAVYSPLSLNILFSQFFTLWHMDRTKYVVSSKEIVYFKNTLTDDSSVGDAGVKVTHHRIVKLFNCLTVLRYQI